MSYAFDPIGSSLLAALDRMQAILRRLGAIQDLTLLYTEAVHAAAAFFDVTQCCLALYDSQTGMMWMQRPCVGLDEVQAQALSAIPAVRIGQFLREWPEHGVINLLTPEYVHLANIALSGQLSERDVLLGLMRAEGQVVGLLRLANKADGTAFTQEEIYLLRLFTGQLGMMIQNLRRLAAEQQARRLAEILLKVPQVIRQPAPFAVTTRGGHPAPADPELRSMLDRLLELLHEAIDYSSASVALCENERLHIIAGRGHTIIPDVIGFSWDGSTDPKIADIVASGQMLHIADTHADPRWFRWGAGEEIRAWIGAPIWAPGHLRHTYSDLIGTLNVDGDRVGAFDDSDVAIVQAFADQMAVVLENQRLYTQMAQRAAELALVNRISASLSSSLDIRAILQNSAIQLAQALDVEQCGIVLLDRKAGYGRVVAEYQSVPDETAKDAIIPIAGNLSLQRILETKSSLAIRDAQHDPLLANVHEVMAKRGVKSILLLPLIVRGEVIGTVGLDELKQMRDFDPAEIELAQTITNQTATAVANARLYEDVRSRVVQLQTAQEVTRRISAILNLRELLAEVSNLVCERFGYYHVHVFLLDETGEYLLARGGSGPVGRQLVVQGYRLRVGAEGLCGLAASTGETFICQDVLACDWYKHCVLLEATRSEMVIPMRLGSRIIGVLDVQSDHRDAFEEADRFVLEILADQVAIAVENARLYQEERDRARELTNVYEELKASDQMKDEFVQTVSHELRTPLTFVKGYLELLLEGMMGEVSAEQRDALQIIFQRTESIIRLVSDIISLARAESVGLSPLPVSLAEIAQAAVQSAQAIAMQLDLELTTDFAADLPLVQGDVQRLTQVFDNLIGNAVKFSLQGGAVRVRLVADGRFVRAEVIDQGMGIPADKVGRIWERFYQIDGAKTRRFGGTGLGLAIVKRLVEAHGGQVGVHSVEGKGSTFFFTVPRADM